MKKIKIIIDNQEKEITIDDKDLDTLLKIIEIFSRD